jgi:NADPH2:quinone reductase
MGLEIVGEVVAFGERVSRWKVGDSVCALLLGGGYAEYAAVDARHVSPVPQGLTIEQAAGLPETVFTVFGNVFERGNLKAGKTLLIHGGASGIGVTTIAMAKALGACVITTGRGADKACHAQKLGADLAVETTSQDFVDVVNGDGGVDVVLDTIGGDYVQKNLNVLKPDGRLSQLSFLSGADLKLNLTPSPSRPIERPKGPAGTRRRVHGLALDRVRPGEDRGGQGIPARAGGCGAQIPRIRCSRRQGHSEDISVAPRGRRSLR